MSKFLNSILPVQEYRYGEFKVFSIFDFMGKMFIAKMAEKKLNKDLMDSEISVTDILKKEIIKGMEFSYSQRNNTVFCEENTCFLVVKPIQFGPLVKRLISILNGKKQNDLPKMMQFQGIGVDIYLTQKRYGSTKSPDYDGPLLLGKVWVDHLIALGMPSENAHKTIETTVVDIVNILNTNRVK